MGDELTKYIKEAQNKGLKSDKIKKNLISAGWDPNVINKLEITDQEDPTKTIFNPSANPIKPQEATANTSTPASSPITNPSPLPKPNNITTGLNTNASVVIPLKTRPWFKNIKVILLSLAGLILVLIIGGAVLAYMYYGLGKTILGHNFFDQKWQQFINSANGELAERDFNFEYQDKGQFKFVPSKLVKDTNLKKVSDRYSPEELAYFDKLISFSITDPGLKVKANEFLNANDTSKPKIDASIKFDYSDEGTTYTIQDIFRLIDLNGYDSLYLNDPLRTYIKEKIDIAVSQYPEYKKDAELVKKKLDEWNSKWFRYEFDKDTIKLMGESLNNGSNWQFIGSMKSRDYKRASNASSIAEQAFEYYKDNNKWPEKISDLKYPVTAPTPADGKCTEEGNKYTLVTRGDSLLITFCLGKDSDEPNYYSSDMKSKNKAGMNVVVLKKPSSTNRYEQYIYNLSFEPYNCPSERKCLFDKDQPEANPFKDTLRKNRPFDIQSFHGVSKIENEWAAHYTLKLDKNKLRNIFISVEKQTVGENEYNSDEKYAKQRKEDFERRLDWWLNNQNITNFDVWLGVNTGRLYKVSWDQDFSSLTSQLNWAYKSITTGALKQSYLHNEMYYENFTPDQRRILDVANINGMAKSYKSFYGGYPSGNKGQPERGPYYPDVVTPITPADGKCTDFYNTYWYTSQGNPIVGQDRYEYLGSNKTVFPDYSITFCLGFKTTITDKMVNYNNYYYTLDDIGLKEKDTLEPGIYRITSKGMERFVCPPDKTCYKPVASPEPAVHKAEGIDYSAMSPEELDKEIEKQYLAIPWSAKLHVSYTASNFGKDKNIDTPKDSKTFEEAQQEIENEISGQTNAADSSGSLTQARIKSRDARRVADIAQIRSAMELYLNDYGYYPKSISELVPNYINPFPEAPIPVDGDCTEAQNTYNYTPKQATKDGAESYSITFCLGANAGSYTKGKHELTPAGVQ